ncbi:MAG TPA: aspartyl protease family protein [Kofleriaceae bacterium]|nr:aspartyl protease family protein [Kofleriaceae bacterium]
MRVLVAAVMVAACGGDDSLEWGGTAGRATAASFAGWVPSVSATASGAGGTLLLDSGAPLTLLDNDHFGALADGEHEVDLAFGELRFPALPVLAFDVINYQQSRQPPLDGLIGGDLLGSFSVSLDYAGGRVWLDDQDSALPDGADDGALDGALEIDASIEGGGVIGVPGATREVGATRFLVEAEVEDLDEPFWVLVDTGASSVVLANEVLDLLVTEGRPRLDGVIVGTAAGAQVAHYTRVWSMRLGAAEQESVPVLVLPDDQIFRSVSDEVGRKVLAVVGGTYLRWFLSTLDYPGGRLVLRPYRETSHIDADEFVGVGFEMDPSANLWRVSRVYPGTDAASEGLAVGEVVHSLAGTDIAGLGPAEVDEVVAGFGLGDELPVGVERDGAMTEVLISVEDLLPAFVSP